MITNSLATDYLDGNAGIVRSPCEKLEKRLASFLRTLGKERVADGFAKFFSHDRERIAEALLAKLKNLPLVDGRPDFSEIGDPIEVAKQWAAETKLGENDLLVRLSKHFGVDGDT